VQLLLVLYQITTQRANSLDGQLEQLDTMPMMAGNLIVRITNILSVSCDFVLDGNYFPYSCSLSYDIL